MRKGTKYTVQALVKTLSCLGGYTKTEEWILWHFSENDIVYAVQEQDSWRRLTVDRL